MILPAEEPNTTCDYAVTTRNGVYPCKRRVPHPGNGIGCVLHGETFDDKHDASERLATSDTVSSGLLVQVNIQ